MTAFRALLRVFPILGVVLTVTLIATVHNYNARNYYLEMANNTYHLHATTKVCRIPGFQQLFKPNVQLPSVCANESCRADYVRHLHAKDAYPIPAIRHILWRNESVSAHFAEQLRTWQNIHPDWNFVLWRDRDLEPFVATHFPGFLAKFKSLPRHIMRVDMIRYMLLFKFGGVYADLDYSLVRSLDKFRRFHAVITREPEAHSLQFLEMTWPAKPLANPAFMMSAPGHIFYHFAMLKLEAKKPDGHLQFAGPIGLTDMMKEYLRLIPIANNPMETVYVPPSFSFYPYPDNRLNKTKSGYLGMRLDGLGHACKSLFSRKDATLQQIRDNQHLKRYCTDVTNLDPITNRSEPVFAVHDMMKTLGVYDDTRSTFFYDKLTDARGHIKNLMFGQDFI